MELTTLKYFVKLSEHLNFTEAAARLFITQSTLSISIKNLERELGVQLFERIGHNVYLSEMGELFLPYAQASIKDAELGIQELAERSGIYSGELRIGVVSSLYPIFMNSLLAFTTEYPDVHISIRYSPSINELVGLISQNQLDLAVSYSTDQTMPLVEHEELFAVPLMAILSKEHPLANKKQLTTEEIAAYPLVLFSEGIHTRNVIDKICRMSNSRLKPHIEVNEARIALALTETGQWISILGGLNIQEHPSLQAIPLADQTYPLKASLLRPKSGYSKPTSQKFVDIIKREVGNTIPKVLNQ